ncbi:MAG TPA: hypothetical protein VJT81_07295 [Burkholderiales bacterium]|nr:hypothetical protein [Burkholderiales bacterium]
MIAWHYTTGQKYGLICADGQIKPSTRFLRNHEFGVCWFSVEQTWEPTANKGVIEHGRLRTLTMLETMEKGFGLVRFGVDEKNLIAWPELASAARMTRETRAALEKVGRDQGSEPMNWRGSIRPVPVRETMVETMVNRTREWERVPG